MNPYIAARSTSANKIFWDNSQENLFHQIYGSMKVFEHRFVDWSGIANQEICAFDVSIKYKNLGLQGLASLNTTWVWNEEFVRQFYATVYIDPDRTKMEFMIGSSRHSVTKQNLENALSIRPRASSIVLHKSGLLNPTDDSSLYKPNTKKARGGLKDEVHLIVKINEHTIFPRKGNRGDCSSMSLKLAHAIYHQKHFDIGHFLLSEMCAVIEAPLYELPYAPHIICLLRHLKLIPEDSDLPFGLKKYSPQLPKPQLENIDEQNGQAQVVQQEIPDEPDVHSIAAQHEISDGQDGQAQDTVVARHEILDGLAVMNQVHSCSHQAQPDRIETLMRSIVQLSAKMDKLSDKVDKGLEGLNDCLSQLSSEFDEMKAHFMENHGPRYVYERKRPKYTRANGSCAAADP